MYYILTALLVCLGFLFVQDVKNRRIHVVLPIAVFGLSAALVWIKTHAVMGRALSNVLFFLVVLGILILYMTIRQKKFSNPFENYFGLGDLLFYLAITPLFVLRGYILFFIGSMIFAIVMQLALRKRMKEQTVPLAGFSALLLSLIVIKDLLFDSYKLILI